VEELTQLVHSRLSAAKGAIRCGAYELAMGRIFEALGTLASIGVVLRAGIVKATSEQERALVALIAESEALAEKMFLMMSNERPNSEGGGLRSALEILLGELRQFAF